MIDFNPTPEQEQIRRLTTEIMGEARAHGAVHVGEEPGTLLLLGAEQVQDLAVAGIGRLAAEAHGAKRAAADDLVHECEADHADAHADRLLGHVGRPYDGPDEVHRMVVARRILRAYR